MESIIDSYASDNDDGRMSVEEQYDNESLEISRKRIGDADDDSSNQRESKNNNTGQSSNTPYIRKESKQQAAKNLISQRDFMQSCDYIPMRLTPAERLQLDVLENALEVCEYTDVVDVTFSHTRKNKYTRILESLIDTLSISCGLITSNNLIKGEALLRKSLTENVPIFRDLFEVGRRFKIMNPSKMRNTYGKLMYLLMDAESTLVKSELNVKFVKPILTVVKFLTMKEATSMLSDPLLFQSTTIGSIDKSQRESAKKELISRYKSDKLCEDDIQRVLDSIGDNEAYKAFNVTPVDAMLRILEESFDSLKPKHEALSLELSSRGMGKKVLNTINYYGSGFSSRYFGGGACLNHDHKTQFLFVKQSLMLWREIMTYMPKLWLLADADMITESYRLADTGQGYQRLQQCPRVGAEMRRILNHVQSQTSAWVGLSVIHLGDRDVPNALVFIDKYTQVPRILKPISQCVLRLPDLVSDPAFHAYVSQEWGSINGLRLQILCDFFKHGFDGSGDDGGSCIDGRLTSAWNWCSKLHKKPYYHVFMYTGFQGFDGDWKED